MASSFTETFDSEKGAPGLGSFSIEFRPGTQHILGPHVTRTSLVAGGPTENFKKDTLVITGADLGTASRAEVLAASIFSGRIDRFRLPVRSVGGWSFSGPTILAWIGNADSPSVGTVGIYDDATLETLASLLGSYVSAQLNFLTQTTEASTPSGSLGIDLNGYDTVRDQINQAVLAKGAEYRCTPQGVLRFAGRGDDSVFRETPVVILTAYPTVNRDGDLWAFQIDGEVEYDYGPEANQVLSHNGDGVTLVDSEDDGGARYGYGFNGTNDAEQDVAIGSTGVWQAADLATQLQDTFCRKNRMNLQVDADSLASYVNAGDHLWVHAPEAFLSDDAENINFAGEETHPIKLRTSSITCPVRSTHGVYVIHNSTAYGGTNAVERLNDYVVFDDSGQAKLEFDSPPGMRKLVRGRGWYRSSADS